MKLRISGTRLFGEQLGRGDRAYSRVLVTDNMGEELGIIEYVGIKLRSGGGTRYGWRPILSGYTASQLLTKSAAAKITERRHKG